MKLLWVIVAVVLGASGAGRWVLGGGLPSLAVPMVAGLLAVLVLPKSRLTPMNCAVLLVAVAAGVLLHADYLLPWVTTGCALVSCSVVSVVVTVRVAGGAVLTAVVLVPLIGWPVLFSRHLPAAAGWLLDAGVYVNPLMALSAVARELPPWTELPAVYRRTSLGQDVGYVRPRGWVTVVGYGLMGLLSAGWWARRGVPLVATLVAKLGARQGAPARPVLPRHETGPTPEAGRK